MTRPTPNFLDLLQSVQRAAPGRPPTLKQLAKRCGICRQYLYQLIWGTSEASDYVVAKIARGLKLSFHAVDSSLAKSRKAS